ncbi:MAG: hypothetical protein K2P94_15960 [Rhodospirillaceae bacterium]|nr:hypothetical protein [Rhodospirillaceae bacterium]
MRRFIVVITAVLIAQTALVNPLSAKSPSPLDYPIEEIKKDIAAIVHCTWREVFPLSHGCTDRKERQWIHLVLTPDGKIDNIWFLPVASEVVGVSRQTGGAIYGVTESARAEQAGVVAIIKKLWPSWTDSEQWLSNAFKKAQKRYAQDSIRVGDTSVCMTESMSATRDDHSAFLVLTKKTDVTEFKHWPCEDDEPGPGLDSCAERDGPRPPENPILHPK